MSLQVWLPLNGNLDNLGLTSVDFITSGVTFADGGKIGQKYLSAGTITIPAIKSKNIFNNNNMSFAFWIYPIGTSGSGAIMGQTSMATGDNRMYTIFQYSTPNDLHLSWQNETATNSATFLGGAWSGFFPANTWTHCCITYNGSVATIYRNGEKYTTASGSQNRQNFEYNFPINGSTVRKLNDVRIYDHCLSPKEVKEISKGLILHYKLDELTNSWLPHDYFPTEYIESAGVAYLTTDYYFNPEIDSCQVKFKGNDVSNNGMIFASNGGKYFWFYYYGSNGIRVYANNGTDGQQGIAGITSDLNVHVMEYKNKHYYIDGTDKGTLTNTYTEDSGPINLFSYGGGSYVFKGRIYYVEIRRNDVLQRLYIPAISTRNSAIGMYDIINHNFISSSNSTAFTAGNVVHSASKVYDVSGYGNNGTINGNLLVGNDTARYTACTYFENYSHYISCNMGTIIPNAITMSCWIKGTNKSPQGGYHLPLNMNSTNYEISITGSSGKARMGFYIGGSRYVSDIGSDILDGKWHMLTNVYDGSTISRYIDGVLINSVNQTGALTALNTLGVGQFPGGTTYGNTQLSESDVRIYTTALTASQVKELYDTAMTVDNKGNIYAREVVEI